MLKTFFKVLAIFLFKIKSVIILITAIKTNPQNDNTPDIKTGNIKPTIFLIRINIVKQPSGNYQATQKNPEFNPCKQKNKQR